MTEPFEVKDCALIAIATGMRAQNLRELRHFLEEIHPDCIYYHFWGGLLNPRFEDPEYQNDFAAWAIHGLNDLVLAERLGIIDPTDFLAVEELRRELIEIIEERLDQTEIVPWAKPDRQFHLIRSKMVVLNTKIQVQSPDELGKLIPTLPPSSIFYHFIDSRRRTLGGNDDFSGWVARFGTGYEPLVKRILDIDPYFIRLSVLREKLAAAFGQPVQGEIL
jgi:hypothetical protein